MILDDNKFSFNVESEGEDSDSITITNYERDKDLSSPYKKKDSYNISKADFENNFPINRLTKPKILIQWDDLCSYVGIGLVLFLKDKYKLKNTFNEELYFMRTVAYLDPIDFAYAFFEDRFEKDLIEKELKGNYFTVMEFAPVSNTLISVMRLYNYSSSITFVFKYDDDKITYLMKDLEKYFKVVRGNECELNYVVLDEYSWKTIMHNVKPTVVFANDIATVLDIAMDDDSLENIEFYGPSLHNNLPGDFKDLYFGKLEGSVLPKRCSVRLFNEQIYVAPGVGNDDVEKLSGRYI